MKYSVYQINLSDRDIYDVNHAEDSFSIPIYYAYIKASMRGDVKPGIEGGFYQKVAVIEAKDEEDAFRISNLGIEEHITRFDVMHSMSVGDILVDEDGKWLVCSSIGFEEIDAELER